MNNLYVYFGKEFHPFKGNKNGDLVLVANQGNNTLKTLKQFNTVKEARDYIDGINKYDKI